MAPSNSTATRGYTLKTVLDDPLYNVSQTALASPIASTLGATGGLYLVYYMNGMRLPSNMMLNALVLVAGAVLGSKLAMHLAMKPAEEINKLQGN